MRGGSLPPNHTVFVGHPRQPYDAGFLLFSSGPRFRPAPEAKKTWESILASKTLSDKGGDLPDDRGMTPDEINRLIKEKAAVTSKCKSMERALVRCSGEMECAKASLALTMCVADVACPLQRGALRDALHEGGGEEEVRRCKRGGEMADDGFESLVDV